MLGGGTRFLIQCGMPGTDAAEEGRESDRVRSAKDPLTPEAQECASAQSFSPKYIGNLGVPVQRMGGFV